MQGLQMCAILHFNFLCMSVCMVSVHIFMGVCVYMYVYLCVHIQAGVSVLRSEVGGLRCLHHLPPYFLRQGLSPNVAAY